MENPIVEVNNLIRVYQSTVGTIRRKKKEITAVNSISFNINKGELFGLLGPNGAGKSTTIKILTTLLAPTSGSCKVFGHNVFGEERYIRPRINFVFGGERGLYWRLSAIDNLKYFSDLYKIDRNTQNKRIPELLELVGLSERAKEKVETYSKGMMQRLQVARGLINDPELLFLDEPTIGLDPVGARDLRKIISSLIDRGKTLLLTTHYMHEADELCDRIAIINKGNIVAMDTPKELKKHAAGISVLELSVLGVEKTMIDRLKKEINFLAISVKQQEQMQKIEIQCENPSLISQDVIKLLEGTKVMEMDIREATLEDAYIKLVGGEL